MKNLIRISIVLTSIIFATLLANAQTGVKDPLTTPQTENEKYLDIIETGTDDEIEMIEDISKIEISFQDHLAEAGQVKDGQRQILMKNGKVVSPKEVAQPKQSVVCALTVPSDLNLKAERKFILERGYPSNGDLEFSTDKDGINIMVYCQKSSVDEAAYVEQLLRVTNGNLNVTPVFELGLIN